MPLLTWLNNCFYIVFIYRLHHYLKTVRNKRNLKKKKKNDNKVINFRKSRQHVEKTHGKNGH